MAMRKVGSRRIEVDGQHFLWRVRRSPTYLQGAFATALTFAVQHEDSGSVLTVMSDKPRPDNWLGHPGAIITPAIVADCIREAVKSGWQPTTSGSPFQLDLRRTGK